MHQSNNRELYYNNNNNNNYETLNPSYCFRIISVETPSHVTLYATTHQRCQLLKEKRQSCYLNVRRFTHKYVKRDTIHIVCLYFAYQLLELCSMG